ncbi:expressed unknown protein [Seminavis robusta]|uniref:Uncharacterized protein n=1 Tax=Seminavis robusta TaxID=568900 RepID=A0A9N8ESG0_9STRA|nr:expressed unknown protein [Seminavis robusta]|eukprot:Sro1824_g300000.1 n/a (620) ;mRNA; f:7631-9553
MIVKEEPDVHDVQDESRDEECNDEEDEDFLELPPKKAARTKYPPGCIAQWDVYEENALLASRVLRGQVQKVGIDWSEAGSRETVYKLKVFNDGFQSSTFSCSSSISVVKEKYLMIAIGEPVWMHGAEEADQKQGRILSSELLPSWKGDGKAMPVFSVQSLNGDFKIYHGVQPGNISYRHLCEAQVPKTMLKPSYPPVHSPNSIRPTNDADKTTPQDVAKGTQNYGGTTLLPPESSSFSTNRDKPMQEYLNEKENKGGMSSNVAAMNVVDDASACTPLCDNHEQKDDESKPKADEVSSGNESSISSSQAWVISATENASSKSTGVTTKKHFSLLGEEETSSSKWHQILPGKPDNDRIHSSSNDSAVLASADDATSCGIHEQEHECNEQTADENFSNGNSTSNDKDLESGIENVSSSGGRSTEDPASSCSSVDPTEVVSPTSLENKESPKAHESQESSPLQVRVPRKKRTLEKPNLQTFASLSAPRSRIEEAPYKLHRASQELEVGQLEEGPATTVPVSVRVYNNGPVPRFEHITSAGRHRIHAALTQLRHLRGGYRSDHGILGREEAQALEEALRPVISQSGPIYCKKATGKRYSDRDKEARRSSPPATADNSKRRRVVA